MVDFCINNYLPAIIQATDHINLSAEEIEKYRGIIISAGAKLLYAAVWQEQIILSLGDGDFLYSPEANELGTELLSTLNLFLNTKQDFEYFNKDFQRGIDIYPGDTNIKGPVISVFIYIGCCLVGFGLCFLMKEDLKRQESEIQHQKHPVNDKIETF